MAADEKCWHLYCVQSKERLSDLTETEALAHVKLLTDDIWVNWFAWTPGFSDWMPVSECPLFKTSRDRRRFPRVKIRVMVTILSGFQRFQTFTQDISIGGILLDREMPFVPANEKVRVILKYTDIVGEPLQFNARLLMDRKHPIRLEFLSAEEKFKKRLYQWVDRALKSQKAA